MIQWLKMFIVLAKNQGSNPKTYMVVLIIISNSSSSDPIPSSDLHRHHVVHTYMAGKHTRKIKTNIFKITVFSPGW